MRMTCKLPDHAEAVERLLEGFVRVCQLIVESGLAPAHPRDTNVKYKLEPAGEEDWKLPQNCIRDGWGDCEDLAGWVAGGYRATGEDPDAVVKVVRTGKNKLHAVVQRGDGEIEDPSKELWYRQPEGIKSLMGAVTTSHGRNAGGSGGVVEKDHRKGGAEERNPYQQKWLDARAAKSKPATTVGNPDDNSASERKAMWAPSASDAERAQYKQDVKTEDPGAADQYRADKQAAAQQAAAPYGVDPYGNPYSNPYGAAPYGYEPMYQYGYGMPDNGWGGGGWQDDGSWVDPRAVRAFQMQEEAIDDMYWDGFDA